MALLDILSEDEKEKLARTSLPSWMDPMLAKLTHSPFSDSGWIYERKLDGERCLAFKEDGEVRLLSRNRKVINVSYPELVSALENQERDGLILDGEIVAFDGDVTSFSKLQQRMHVSSSEEVPRDIPVYYYLFDILYAENHDLTEIDLRGRKRLLKQAIEYEDPLRYTVHRNREGRSFLEEACERGWEGLIAKKADSPYVHSRSSSWLKFKCVNQQEFVIGGYTDPEGERIGFGALLIGYYEHDSLRYAGKVGTGYDESTLRDLSERLKKMERDDPPFDLGDPPKSAHWVEPELVCEVGFTEWTKDDRLRHPRFLGLRRDKSPKKVVKEEPVDRS